MTPISTSFRIRQFFLIRALKGDSVKCPICTNEFITFLPFGRKKKRNNALCIKCLSLERHRLIWLFLERETDLFTSSSEIKLLHVAPETCFFPKLKKQKSIDYFPVDKFEKGYSYPSGTKNMDITQIKEGDNIYDAIICNHVLEHVADSNLALSELFRVLKPKGWAILQVPIEKDLPITYEDVSITTPEGREKAFGQVDHLRQYGLDYPEILKRAGFDVSPITYTQSFAKEEKFRYGFSKDRTIYLCTKPEI